MSSDKDLSLNGHIISKAKKVKKTCKCCSAKFRTFNEDIRFCSFCVGEGCAKDENRDVSYDEDDDDDF